MGRKGAPEPLSLTEDSASGSGSLGESYNPANTLTLTESTSMGLSPAASLQVTPTPTSSKSPKSPRSPLARPNALQKPQTPVHAHSPSEPQPGTPNQFGTLHRPPYSVDDVDAPQLRNPRQDIGNRPKTSAGQQASAYKQPSQPKRGHAEHSRSASRFWGFGKSSKSNQFRHIHTNSSGEVMPRSVDVPGVQEKAANKKRSPGMYPRAADGVTMAQQV